MRVELLDSTLRDGAQGEGVDFSLEDKRQIALLLDKLGVTYIEGGNPSANPKDAAFFEAARRELFLKKSVLCAFGATVRPALEPAQDAALLSLLAADTQVISIFGKCSLFHVDKVLRVTPEENLRMIEQTVRYLTQQGRTVFFDAEHFFDGCAQDKDYAFSAVRAALASGAKRAVLCDTSGGTLPDEVARRVRELLQQNPDVQVGIHCHNDIGMAAAATIAAVQAGATHAQVTLAGVGERCGNADLATVAATLGLKLGVCALPPESLPLLTPVCRTARELMNLSPDPRAPYVGYSAFAHKGGMHIDAVSKEPRTFEHISPQSVGNRRRVIISEQVGRSGVHERLKRLLPDISRDDERVTQVTQRLKRREKRGYAYENADGSFDLMALDTLGLRKRFFNVLDFHVLSGMQTGGQSAQAYIKIAVDGREEINAAEGEGPVNALDTALRKALRVFYPQLDSMYLRDFKVRVVDNGGTASVVRVLIESTDGAQVWTTVGVSENIIRACFKALVDSVEYFLAFVR